MIVLPASDYAVMPWKNGGGTTTQIYVAGDDPTHYDWRVSIATVAGDGPFSRFPGYDRHIMMIEGGGMTLTGGPHGDITVSPAFVPRSFSGDWDIFGRLKSGPLRDFNLIVRRDKFASGLETVVLAEAAEFNAEAGWLLLHVLDGNATVADFALQQGDSAVLNPGESARIAAPAGIVRLAICKVWLRQSQ